MSTRGWWTDSGRWIARLDRLERICLEPVAPRPRRGGGYRHWPRGDSAWDSVLRRVRRNAEWQGVLVRTACYAMLMVLGAFLQWLGLTPLTLPSWLQALGG